MLPGYTGEQAKKMQDGDTVRQRVNSFMLDRLKLRADS
jgi:hypothetical protein